MTRLEYINTHTAACPIFNSLEEAETYYTRIKERLAGTAMAVASDPFVSRTLSSGGGSKSATTMTVESASKKDLKHDMKILARGLYGTSPSAIQTIDYTFNRRA